MAWARVAMRFKACTVRFLLLSPSRALQALSRGPTVGVMRRLAASTIFSACVSPRHLIVTDNMDQMRKLI